MFKEEYRCPKCDCTIVVHVKLRESPTCQNPEAHSATAIVMMPADTVESDIS